MLPHLLLLLLPFLPPSNTQGLRMFTHKAQLQKDCTDLTIHQEPINTEDWTERMLETFDTLPEQHLRARCRDNRGDMQFTQLDLNNCLGWDADRGGGFVARAGGNGMWHGGCWGCRYMLELVRGADLSCWCKNVRESEKERGVAGRRSFNLEGVIRAEDGRLKCHHILGVGGRVVEDSD
ncbi:hypothetical protein BDV28DRAFT_144892 [Aspergillus coremiiformis]|uniref:Cyanovirin-N domain-containing protein n=1 Tax=Aspergillus coremiiformis TaxID=138285 RepID=A0A5N6ZJ09_9EURO|nr:hypothetical protein BDV28DRAFT_144892 [Aspergillus coremiiformis]